MHQYSRTLVIKTNLEYKPCQQFYEEISKNKDLLIRVHNTIKYSTTNQKSETVASGCQYQKIRKLKSLM